MQAAFFLDNRDRVLTRRVLIALTILDFPQKRCFSFISSISFLTR